MISGAHHKFALFSSLLNGEPVAANVAAAGSLEVGGEHEITPLVVSNMAATVLTCRDGKTACFGA